MIKANWETLADATVSFRENDFATKFVEAMDRNSNGSGALSLILLAGPNAASSIELDRPMKAASIKDMRGGHA
jgi:hypothetical protein